MSRHQATAPLARELVDRQLLTHPFYVRWQAGELQPGELGAYAEQYRYFEAFLPGFLRRLAAQLGDAPAADGVRRNLADEESNPKAHVELFDDFACAVGAEPAAAASPATRTLLATYEALSDASPGEGLAALVAYESQAPLIAASKAQGLREWYRLDGTATRFWDVHAAMDLDHASWSIDSLSSVDVPAEKARESARRALDAWWGFLDEREAARPAASTRS